ncbi:BolA family protein [Marinomonas mediterranea]|jgi:transcriptional regulator, BolA protein family|uniref:BolA family protein n=1 Tax=Marinomonas mediterranea (strain ATCC 700492 / JCM 21426 / NBRC 103028 / MMB-1) TaxID=717774 RepID=F2K4L0_MARM1|nr:BolA/IbaG family iron-sulfur metabolism protein [Marinomonas mediterranea]ADZ91403.1 BolA family protein [Marinomonas mediterranea MMB-1]WCN09374.1 BolA/IbaG family iron-sulfur metabolism protein [Marinomonas mediterranea]WCN13451.1 BolA/IbaG family iron-sulfur metabolism protein [Marinomonas mediterranea]WCN17517.1 BolA/IbaG family iron-sulfur metabolism protein [Marinomonas mediterranea MMB-1]
MIVEQEIRQLIERTFDSEVLDLTNESYMHNVPEGSESHFKLTLVSNEFSGKRLVQRHQMIYGALTEQMQKIHALALHLYTTDEWAKRSNSAPLSPNCHGGGR